MRKSIGDCMLSNIIIGVINWVRDLGQHAELRDGADAYRDQEMARLFERCGWTQERIARQMGKKQAWVSKRLCLGRFLSFIPSGNNASLNLSTLTERAFRSLWQKTGKKDDERRRFAQVADMLGGRGVGRDASASQRNQATMSRPARLRAMCVVRRPGAQRIKPRARRRPSARLRAADSEGVRQGRSESGAQASQKSPLLTFSPVIA
jgi:hypothetical protein